MAFSYNVYTGDGTTTQFAVPFGYIRREHVLATVAGSPATFTWVNDGLIQMDVVPANGATVRVYRQTPLTNPLVDFTDGSTLVAADLDTNARQSIYTQQELDDSLVDGLAGVIPNGDKGDITTSVNGSVWTIDNGAVTSAKIADGTIVDGDISANAEIAVSKLADGTARQLLQTDAAGTGVEWTSNIDVPGTLDVTGVATFDSTVAVTGNVTVPSLNGGPLAGARNRIINGDMRIDQRNAGAAVTLTSAGVYIADRWQGWEDTDGSATATQSTTAPTGYTNSLLYTVTSADTSLSAAQYTILGQRIEGFDAADFAFGTASAATITIGFWVRSSITGIFAGGISNSAGNRSYVFTYTISAANTWEYKSAAIPGDTSGTWLTDNGIGLNLYFSLGAGSSYQATAGSWGNANSYATSSSVNLIGTNGATFYITGVQLETGSVATPFERRSYGQELALAQRYYQKGVAILNASPVTAAAYLPVVMRALPSVTTISIDSGTGGAWAALSNSTLYQSAFNSNSSGSTYAASAEL